MKSVLLAVIEQWAVLEAFWAGSHLENSDPSTGHPPFPSPQKAGCHGWCPEAPRDPPWHRARLGSLGYVWGAIPVTTKPRITYPPSQASLPFQRPNWYGKGSSSETLKGPKSALSKPLSAFKDFPHQWFCLAINSESLLADLFTAYPGTLSFPIYIPRKLQSFIPTSSLVLV